MLVSHFIILVILPFFYSMHIFRCLLNLLIKMIGYYIETHYGTDKLGKLEDVRDYPKNTPHMV